MITPSWIVLGRSGEVVTAVLLGADGVAVERTAVDHSWIAERAAGDARWVWSDTNRWYPALLTAGIRIERCHDLRLAHAILRDSALVTDAAALRRATGWDHAPGAAEAAPALFGPLETAQALPADVDEALAEFARQREALAAALSPGRLRLLVAAESAGALVAAELQATGLPWDPASHHRVLTETLGERIAGGEPSKLTDAAARARAALGDPTLGLDSPPKVLRALHRVGVHVQTTSRWELMRHDHPAVAPLIEYKQLSRLYAANGWAWLAEWVHDGRFRPVYVPAGVVTGRWASSGGGALQIPRRLRSAVRADPGWTLVVADVAQLEPRVLAAMSRDRRLADAARGRDLYAGIVDDGAVPSRSEAKVAMLGAMYGATTGESGRLLPRLRRAYPEAMAMVDAAARTGENGGVVSTWLGRSTPEPGPRWRDAQAGAGDVDADDGDIALARRSAGDRGRFTRNFIVQGTAAEWASAWLADLRNRLHALPPVDDEDAAPRSGPVFRARPHLAFFLHDEIVVHTPEARADEVADAVREAAASAGRLLFGDFPVDFPLDLRITRTAEKE